MKKDDLFLGAILLFLTCFLPLALFRMFPAKGGDRVSIYTNGVLYATYSLYEDRDIRITVEAGFNIVSIHDGRVYVSDSDCSGRDCVRTGEISRPGDFILCVPHGLYLVIASDGGTSVPDGVTY